VPNSKGTEGPELAATWSAPRSQIVVSPVDTGGVLTDGRDRTTEIGDCHFCAFSTEQQRSRRDSPAPHPL